MSSRGRRTRAGHAALLFAAVCALALPLGAPAQPAVELAEMQRAPVQRTCDGKVVNKSEAAMPGAIVYLKDSKSLAVRTFIADDGGHFHFGQLAQNTDYELWAADGSGQRSKSKTISSFDSKNDYNFTLRIDSDK